MKKIFIFLLCVFLISSALAQDNLGEEIFYTLDDKEISYNEIISSPKVVLFIWTSWCYFCRIEMVHMNKDFSSHSDINFFYVNLGEKKTKVERLINFLDLNKNITQNILLDPSGMLSDKFNIIGVPTYIFFKNGNAVYKTNIISNRLLKEVFEDE